MPPAVSTQQQLWTVVPVSSQVIPWLAGTGVSEASTTSARLAKSLFIFMAISPSPSVGLSTENDALGW